MESAFQLLVHSSQRFVTAVVVVVASWLLSLDAKCGSLQVMIPELEYPCVPPGSGLFALLPEQSAFSSSAPLV